jgi:hypothetical protein
MKWVDWKERGSCPNGLQGGRSLLIHIEEIALSQEVLTIVLSKIAWLHK